MADEFPGPATVNAKVQWSAHHLTTHDHRPGVGTHLQLLAPSQRAHAWTVVVKSLSGKNNEDIVLGFLIIPINPLPTGTSFELVWVNKNHHHVVAIGETL